jgi:glucans biosynthesis protein
LAPLPPAFAVARRQLATLALLLAAALIDRPAFAQGFGFDDVAREAQALARQPYADRQAALPGELAALTYDQYRDIRFRPERALWRADGLPFELMFFHLGKFQTHAVRLHEITPQGVRRIGFDAADFDYGKNRLAPARWGDIGMAGFRVHYPLNSAQYKDELTVFLGASYFRALGRGQHYGLSARGLAIDTVGGRGEEFPRFTAFWIERPAPGASTLVIHALLDSPRATGAYRFTLRPGEATEVDVRARLFLREGVATLGIAPLTSMFQHGENQPRPGDFRPEVHDSDGLMVASASGEWLWRPLSNPKRPFTSSFALDGLAGFGLMQRDRAYANYEDPEAQYERRPSVWVTPEGDWGAGRVEMLQLSTPDETNDNVVAYWVPARLPAPGQPLDLAWTLRWQGDSQQRPPNGWTLQSRTGRSYAELGPNETQFIVDFDGPALRALAPETRVDAVVSAGPAGRIAETNAYRNTATGAWRMTLRVERLESTQPIELRAFLRTGSHALTETWTSVIQPE